MTTFFFVQLPCLFLTAIKIIHCRNQPIQIVLCLFKEPQNGYIKYTYIFITTSRCEIHIEFPLNLSKTTTVNAIQKAQPLLTRTNKSTLHVLVHIFKTKKKPVNIISLQILGKILNAIKVEL